MPVSINSAADPSDDSVLTLARWHQPDGTVVAAGQEICELESDKATADLAAPSAGVLRHLARVGDRVRPGDDVARIDPLP